MCKRNYAHYVVSLWHLDDVLECVHFDAETIPFVPGPGETHLLAVRLVGRAHHPSRTRFVPFYYLNRVEGVNWILKIPIGLPKKDLLSFPLPFSTSSSILTCL